MFGSVLLSYGFGTLLRLSFIAVRILRAVYARHSCVQSFCLEIVDNNHIEICEIGYNSCPRLESCGLIKRSDSLKI